MSTNTSEYLLEVKDLHTSFFTDSGEVKAVNGVSFTLKPGEIMGIVGESGSGKSVTAYSIMRILADTGRITGGQVLYRGENLATYDNKKMAGFRGKCCSIIFQDPMTSLNPVFTVGSQIMEAIRLHTNKSKAEVKARAIEMLELVGVNEPAKRINQYPHELSGGMRQRVMIQAQILELMQDLQKRLGMAIIMVTHDLGVIADMCDKIVVMYGGSICERGTADDIFYDARHEYTKGLLRSIPNVNNSKERLIPISGTPINLLNMPKGCAFCSRCDKAMKICLEQKPQEVSISETHQAACWMNIKKMMEEQAGGANA